MTPEALEVVERDGPHLFGLQRCAEEFHRWLDPAEGQGSRKFRALRLVGEQRCAEVFRCERLQRMLEHEAAARVLKLLRRCALARHRFRQIVEQLVDQRGGRQGGVVANAASRVRDHQTVTRGQQQVEEQVAFVVTALSVA